MRSLISGWDLILIALTLMFFGYCTGKVIEQIASHVHISFGA